ncbi:MAG: MotA/TolQ/ExbB proton channel family protein [Planctomycetota bacterium]|nr:MotA/TolQ/ExbB proton channel family protein [Planctomycetota bacterium]
MSRIDGMMYLLAQTEDAERGMSWFDTIRSGGPVGFIIIVLSIGAMALVVLHLLQIRRSALLPPDHLDQVEEMLARDDVNGALEYCLDPDHDSYFTRIMSAGLTRFQRSAFGAFEIKNAIEEAGEDQTARLYRSTDALGLIGSIAPLLGLLGTVLGMVGAFESISKSAGSNYEELASSISMALVTTLMGLVLAIPTIALFTFFRNRIDAIASEASVEIERLVLYLESAGPARPAPVTPTRLAPPAPRPRPQPGPEGGKA